MDKITIVTVTFNCVSQIEETIKSVILQDYCNIEYIVVDGKSNDGTYDVIKKYRKQLSKIIYEKDTGIYDAMNKGIENATGDWILFLNAGDKLHDLNIISRIFDGNEFDEFDVVWGEIKAVTKYGIVPQRFDVPFYENKKFFYGMGFSHQGVFVRTDKAKKYKFDLQFKCCADYNMMTQIYLNGGKFKYVPETISTIEGRFGFSEENNALQLREVAKILGIDKSFRFKFFYTKWRLKQIINRIIG